MAKRVEYIDIAKGIGILLVVMGHNDFGLVSPFFYKIIYAFHMPLFFFLSGMFFKPDIPFLGLLRRRFDSLIKPYLAILMIIFVMSITFTKINIDMATTHLLKALYANGHYIDWVQLWFLPHLFALNIFAFVFYKLLNPEKLPWLRWIALIIMLVIGVLTIDWLWPFTLSLLGKQLTLYGLPLSADLLLVSGFFFILGCEINKFVPEKVFANPFTLLISTTGLLALVIFLPYTIDFNTRYYASLPVNTLEALLGITLTLSLSKQIEKITRLSSLFKYLGQSSLYILMFHVPIQETWGEKMFFIFNNQTISYWISYFAGVIGPLLINQYIIQPNPIVRNWFGSSNGDKKQDKTAG